MYVDFIKLQHMDILYRCLEYPKYVPPGIFRSEWVKDPMTEKHLSMMFSNVKVKNEFSVLIWTMIIFLFRTLLRVGHVVVSPHTLHRRDVKFFKWGAMVSVNSSKTKQKGSAHKIPLSRVEDLSICPVFWLEKIIKIYPGVRFSIFYS